MTEREARAAINRDYRRDEAACVTPLLARARLAPADAARIRTQALALAQAVRSGEQSSGGIEALLREYDLSSQERVLLMCLAEALLRIPDAATAERLIRDTLGRGDWDRHLGQSESLLVNASTWGLLLGGVGSALCRIGSIAPALWQSLTACLGGGVRLALEQAMQVLPGVFVLGGGGCAAGPGTGANQRDDALFLRLSG